MRPLRRALYYIMIAVPALFLTALGIDAVDNRDQLPDSVFGRWFGVEKTALCPEGMAWIPDDQDGFCLDLYEASPASECPVAEPSSQADTRTDLDHPECRPVSVAGARPWRFVSQVQAAAACAKAGKRLPSNGEWQAAALGTPDPSADWSADDCQVARNWPEQPGLTGSGAACRSPFGVYDLVGNVWEWVRGESVDGVFEGMTLPAEGHIISATAEGVPVATGPEGDQNLHDDYLWMKSSGVRGLARGGYWENRELAGVHSAYLVMPPETAAPGVGFRCAR